MNTKEIPVLLLTGYLGSGKTTLVNHILHNRQGIRFAVIVNDLGEINIDAELIQRGGIVNQQNDSLVALQNGCICCTLQTDLIEQLFQLLKTQQFDYIVIEASGICDPEPIAQTLCTFPTLGENYSKYGRLRLDCITTVVDALRMESEFDNADKLTAPKYNEDDIENLLIQQVEFCNLILLNKASEVSPESLNRIKSIIHALQPKAEIIECNHAKIDLNLLLHTRCFNYNQVAASAGWIQEIGKSCHHDHEEGSGHHDHHDCHCHHHHDEGEADEYGISTFTYYRRAPFSMNKFDYFLSSQWPKNIIRAKGVCYFNEEYDMTYLFEQAGVQKQISPMGQWYAAMPEEQLVKVLQQDPSLANDWDEQYGDRMQKIVIIGQHLDREKIIEQLDFCLAI